LKVKKPKGLRKLKTKAKQPAANPSGGTKKTQAAQAVNNGLMALAVVAHPGGASAKPARVLL
jgi:hypothetical protein